MIRKLWDSSFMRHNIQVRHVMVPVLVAVTFAWVIGAAVVGLTARSDADQAKADYNECVISQGRGVDVHDNQVDQLAVMVGYENVLNVALVAFTDPLEPDARLQSINDAFNVARAARLKLQAKVDAFEQRTCDKP